MNGNQVNQIVADAYNHIWIDTNQKLIEFNPRNGSFRTYLTTDGSILLHRFPLLFVKQKMAIFIGAAFRYLHGYSIKRVGKKASAVKTKITDIKLQGESLIFGDRKSSNSINRIELHPDDQKLEISFLLLTTVIASKIRYAYRLIGVDKACICGRWKNSAFIII